MRSFTDVPSWGFAGFKNTCNMLNKHLTSTEKEKFQIIVDSDLDGVSSATIFYNFIENFFPEVEIVYSMHTGKKHGLSKEIHIDKDTTLVVLPDAGVNDVDECKALYDKGIDVICLDHHIIESANPYAAIVNCMDGVYPNTNLCGAGVTWVFLYGFCEECIPFPEEYQTYLLKMLDLVAVATISDIMMVTNEDNMYFVQNGLRNIHNNALIAFFRSQEVSLSSVTIEDVKFKLSPLASAMIRMGSMPEKELLFRAFIDDYEEFDYEKRGSIGIETENIYDRVVRLCKNAKSRQDRAKKKLLEECQVHEFPHILLVEYQSEAPSTLTGLVANEFANQYSKPCICYRSGETIPTAIENKDVWYSGSARNYDGSPIDDLKGLLSDAFGDDGDFAGHANAFGAFFVAESADVIGSAIEKYIDTLPPFDVEIGSKQYNVDFAIDSGDVDIGMVKQLDNFSHFTGYGFAPVTVLVKNITASQDNFQTMGKNTFNWKIQDDITGLSYVKFKVDRATDALCQKFDDIDFSSPEKGYTIDAICTFGLNVYKGEIHQQAIVKDYVITGAFTKDVFDNEMSNDFDLDLGI